VLWVGADYGMGTAGRMGPGYFPKVLAGLLIIVGIAALVRSVMITGTPVTPVAWKALALVLAATTAFGLLLPRVGVAVSLLVLCVGSAAASRNFRFEARATLGVIALSAACVAVFVKGLGVPMPLWGTWLEPHLQFLPVWLR
jgi:hypothetical protein